MDPVGFLELDNIYVVPRAMVRLMDTVGFLKLEGHGQVNGPCGVP